MAMTTSSREAFPARSPIPLMVHSICRAPAIAPARLLAVERPRSFWQCVEKMTLSAPGVFATRSAIRPPNSCGRFQPACAGIRLFTGRLGRVGIVVAHHDINTHIPRGAALSSRRTQLAPAIACSSLLHECLNMPGRIPREKTVLQLGFLGTIAARRKGHRNHKYDADGENKLLYRLCRGC